METSSYGLWFLVFVNSAIFIVFAFSFFRPKTRRDWRSFGAFSAFLVALFTEMYGFPLTIYFLSGWLQTTYPNTNWLAHDSGHLLEMLFGWESNPHYGPFHFLSFAFIGGGFILLSAAWRVLYIAQQTGTLAQSGPYARVRHPQYVGFVLILVGFLFQWPTILTLAMFPVLLAMYWRLALHEEREVEAEMGDAYRFYAARVPSFMPRLRDLASGVKPASDHDVIERDLKQAEDRPVRDGGTNGRKRQHKSSGQWLWRHRQTRGRCGRRTG